MKTVKRLLLAALAAFLLISAASADEKARQAVVTNPILISSDNSPITVKAGNYELFTIIQDFPPGAGIAPHKHGGYLLVTVLNGEMTLREKGNVSMIKATESWIESPGNVHAVVNEGKETVRVVISLLLPKGAEATTLVK